MDEKEPSLDAINKLQIADWLRQADKFIRIGRYSAADELLQKVFEIDPDNAVAESYQQRIEFLVKQLSQRVGVSVEAQLEIRTYTDRSKIRETNRLNSYLAKAHKFLEDGYLKQASKFISKALALDSNNIYANALAERLAELKRLEDEKQLPAQNELQYSAVFKESWRNGKPTQQQQEVLESLRKQLKISDERKNIIEKEVKKSLYKETLHSIWLTGGLAAFTPAEIDRLRKEFDISLTDHSSIEAQLLREVRKNKIKATICVIDENENDLIEMVHRMRSHSYAVITAQEIGEAISIIRNVHPDIITVDVSFGGGHGCFDVFEAARSTKLTADIPIIFCGSHFDHTMQIIAKRLGVDEFILKPIDYEMLFAIIDGKLRRRKIEDSMK